MKPLVATIAALALALVGCAAKRPVLYPNDTYHELGDAEAQEIVDYCLEVAREAEIAESRTKGAAKGATGGAIFGAALGGLVGWIFGNPGKGAAAGAAHGGGAGAVKGAAESGESGDLFKGYVEACIREQGLQPIGWEK